MYRISMKLYVQWRTTFYNNLTQREKKHALRFNETKSSRRYRNGN
jgi:hypothetical protein